jgi:hypothetical protein
MGAGADWIWGGWKRGSRLVGADWEPSPAFNRHERVRTVASGRALTC